MQAIQRFNVTVSTLTVAVMFAVIAYLLPMLQASAFPAQLAKLLPFVTPSQLVEASKWVLAALATFGTYNLLAGFLAESIDRIAYLKSFIFGAAYVEGTWVGRFMAGPESNWTVEHFEQNLEGVVIRGHAFDRNGTLYASWTSSAVAIDVSKGVLTYTYNCDVMGRTTPQQGIAVFNFERADGSKPPERILGYSTDLTDGHRSPNNEVRISSYALPLDQALKRARDIFP